jgi:hypothetical protein
MYRISPSRSASAIATALRSFATSIPTKAPFGVVMIGPPLMRTDFYRYDLRIFLRSAEASRFFAPTWVHYGVARSHRQA